MSEILYKETAGQLETASGSWTPIPGLEFKLPAVSTNQTTALITLNLPNPYASGSNFPGGTIGIAVNGAVLVNIGCFSSDSQQPQSFGRKPVTLVIQVQLSSGNTQLIQGMWQNVRNSTVIIDTPATLSAIIS